MTFFYNMQCIWLIIPDQLILMALLLSGMTYIHVTLIACGGMERSAYLPVLAREPFSHIEDSALLHHGMLPPHSNYYTKFQWY